MDMGDFDRLSCHRIIPSFHDLARVDILVEAALALKAKIGSVGLFLVTRHPKAFDVKQRLYDFMIPNNAKNPSAVPAHGIFSFINRA